MSLGTPQKPMCQAAKKLDFIASRFFAAIGIQVDQLKADNPFDAMKTKSNLFIRVVDALFGCVRISHGCSRIKCTFRHYYSLERVHSVFESLFNVRNALVIKMVFQFQGSHTMTKPCVRPTKSACVALAPVSHKLSLTLRPAACI